MELAFLFAKIILPIVFVILFMIFSNWVNFAFNKLIHPGYGRDLLQRDIEKISELATRLSEEKDSTKYPQRYLMMKNVLVAFVVPVAISVSLYWIFYQHFRGLILERVPQNADHVFARTDFSFSGILVVFAAMGLGMLISVYCGYKSKKLRQFYIYKLGWGQLVPDERDLHDFYYDIQHLYYSKKIDIHDPDLTADAISWKIFQRPNVYYIVIGLILVALFSAFFRFDLYHYEWIDSDVFVKNRYLSTQEIRFSSSEVVKVERQCRIIRSKEKKAKAHLEYIVTGPSNIKFDLGHEPWENLKSLITEIENLPNVERPPLKIMKALPVTGEPESVKTCQKFLHHEYSESTAKFLEDIYEFKI